MGTDDWVKTDDVLPVDQGMKRQIQGQTCNGKNESDTYKTILMNTEGGICRITMNRPQKRNALSFQMYNEISRALRTAMADDTCSLAVLTGAGTYYTSGNDQANITDTTFTTPDRGAQMFKDFITELINFSKPLISLVNGPAVGAGVTTLALFDAVYASDQATFQTPFTQLALAPEGCSSYLFPRLMGPGRASELLLFNKKLTALEARDRNLVTEVIPQYAFVSETDRKLKAFAKLPKESLQASKMLMRNAEKQKLHDVNDAEYETLTERIQSKEAMTVALNFLKKKKRSSKL